MKLNKLSVLEAHSERLNGTSLRSWMECLLGPICLFSLFLLLSLLTDAQRRNCAVQLSRMHPRQLSLLSSELIKQMPPYPTFYKEQHVIDRSLARKRLYFNFDWLGPPPKDFPLPPKKGSGEGRLNPSQRIAYKKILDLIIILYMRPKTHFLFVCLLFHQTEGCYDLVLFLFLFFFRCVSYC